MMFEQAAVDRDAGSRRIARRSAIVLTLLTVSGFFISTKGNPFGIIYFNEVATAFSAIFFVAGFLMRGHVRQFDLLVFLVPLIGVCASALIAKVTYGQPLMYGLIEERRWLSLYLFFPLRAAFVGERSPEFVLRAILIVAVIVSIGGFLYSAGIVTGFNDLTQARTELREDRANFGTVYVASALILTVAGWNLRRRSLVDIAALALSLAFLLFVAQTRQVIVGLAFALAVYGLFLTPGRGRGLLNLIAALIVIPTLILFAYANELGIFEQLYALFSSLFEDDRLLQNARVNSIITIWREFSAFGHGALSQQWNGGFLGMYGHFVLADLGIFGTIHRFGVMSVIVALITPYMLGYMVQLARISVGAQFSRALLCCGLFLVFMWPTGAILEHRSITLAMLLALATISMRAQRRVAIPRARAEAAMVGPAASPRPQ